MPTIKDLSLTLEDSPNPKFIVDKSRGLTFWTRKTTWSHISMNASSVYVPEIDSAAMPNYIHRYYIGIAAMKIELALLRGEIKLLKNLIISDEKYLFDN